jgi:GAF domain-containing protein
MSDLLAIVHNLNRLAALARTGLLDSPVDESFDRLTRLAARIIKTPMALVSLVDRDRQFFKSSIGLPEPWRSRRETPLTHSFCQHVVALHEPVVIPDARKDPTYRDNPAIRELGIVAYCGVPLTALGFSLGAFCVLDEEPRTWSYDEVQTLKELGECAIHEIEVRSRLSETETALRVASDRVKHLEATRAVAVPPAR